MRIILESILYLLVALFVVLLDTSFFSLYGFPIFSLGIASLVVVFMNLFEPRNRTRGVWMAGILGLLGEIFPFRYFPLEIFGASFLWFLFLAVLIKYGVKEYVRIPDFQRHR
jgi:hypothetical protein